MDMRSYIIRRFLILIPTVIAVLLLIFVLVQSLTPVERASLYVKDPRGFRDIPAVIEKYHLDDPFPVQFYHWMAQVLNGNLGWSRTVSMPVRDAIVHFFPATLELIIFATPLIIWVSLRMGIASAINRGKMKDHVTRVASIVGYALPNFWLGLLLLMIFYGFFTGLFPPGRLSPSVDIYVNSAAFARYTHINTLDAILNLDFWVLVDALRHLVLPVTTLVVSGWALLTRIMRSSMLEALGRGYVTTARAKGLDEHTVVHKHAKRNALISVLTVTGFLVIGLVSGVFITETIFNFKGIGWFAVRAATQLDIPAVVGVTLVLAIFIIIVNLVVDLLYARVDPRVRLG